MIQTTLFKLGISSRYKGYKYIVFTIENALANDQETLDPILDGVCRNAAQVFGVSVSSVHRNIRTVIDRLWNEGDLEFCAKVFQYHIVTKPSVGDFLSALLQYERRCSPAEHALSSLSL